MRLPSLMGTITLRSIMATDSSSCSVVLRLARASLFIGPPCWACAPTMRVRARPPARVAAKREAGVSLLFRIGIRPVYRKRSRLSAFTPDAHAALSMEPLTVPAWRAIGFWLLAFGSTCAPTALYEKPLTDPGAVFGSKRSGKQSVESTPDAPAALSMEPSKPLRAVVESGRSQRWRATKQEPAKFEETACSRARLGNCAVTLPDSRKRSEEHTSEL